MKSSVVKSPVKVMQLVGTEPKIKPGLQDHSSGWTKLPFTERTAVPKAKDGRKRGRGHGKPGCEASAATE